MSSAPIGYAFFGGLVADGVGRIVGLLASGKPRLARALCCSFALLGGLLELGACGLSLLGSVGTHWDISAGVPFLAYGFRLDALSTYFNLILSLLATAVSI